jgi:glycosyltransferase involved in cell wall biosynthesis
MIQKGNSPLVAVYMITYNHGSYIDQAISSVMDQQTNFPVQLFIGDDCSKDNTSSICLNWAERFPDKIVFLDTPINLGIYQNATRVFNICVQSGAKYIALLEGDDYWSDANKLQKQVDLLESDDSIAGSYHQTEYLFNSGERKAMYKKLELRKNLSTLIGKYAPFHTSSFVFRAKHFCRPAWFQNIDSIDLAMYAWHGQFGDMVGFPEVMSVYRVHGAGLTASVEHNEKFHQKRATLHQMMRGKIQPPFSNNIKQILDYHIREAKGKCSFQFGSVMFVCQSDRISISEQWMLMGLNAEIIPAILKKKELTLQGLNRFNLGSWKWWNSFNLKRALLRNNVQFPEWVIFENHSTQVQFQDYFSQSKMIAICLEDLQNEFKTIVDENQLGDYFATYINSHFLPLKS